MRKIYFFFPGSGTPIPPSVDVSRWVGSSDNIAHPGAGVSDF